MAKLLSNNLEVIVSAAVCGAIGYFVSKSGGDSSAEDNVMRATILSAVVGGYAGYLSKCYRKGKEVAASDDSGRD